MSTDDEPGSNECQAIEILPYSEAVEKIKRSRKPLFFRCSTRVDFYPVQEKQTLGHGAIPIAKPVLLEFLRDAWPEHWRPKIAIKLIAYTDRILIGTTA